MKHKKLSFLAVTVLFIILALHFIPIHAKTVTACAAHPTTKRGRYILGASKSSIDAQAQAIQSFNKIIDCPTDRITFELYVL